MRNTYLLTFILLLIAFRTHPMLKNLVKRHKSLITQTLRHYSDKPNDHENAANLFAGSGIILSAITLKAIIPTEKNENDTQPAQLFIESKQAINE
jgi:hypothetical protein